MRMTDSEAFVRSTSCYKSILQIRVW